MDRIGFPVGMAGKAPTRRAVDSLYGEATKETRAWAVDYMARNHEMLDLMARI